MDEEMKRGTLQECCRRFLFPDCGLIGPPDAPDGSAGQKVLAW